jgi:hypothetical protein
LSLLSDSRALSVTGKNRPQSTASKLFFRTESASSDKERSRQKILLFIELVRVKYTAGWDVKNLGLAPLIKRRVPLSFEWMKCATISQGNAEEELVLRR